MWAHEISSKNGVIPSIRSMCSEHHLWVIETVAYNKHITIPLNGAVDPRVSMVNTEWGLIVHDAYAHAFAFENTVKKKYQVAEKAQRPTGAC